LKVALKHGCNDTALWTPCANEQTTIQQTGRKGIKNRFHAIIDFVNTKATAERDFKLLHPVSF